MITETEKRALQLAKKVFEHFTHDALPIAREILAMENELGQSPLNGKLTSGAMNNFPVAELTPTAIAATVDPAQSVRQLHEELAHKPEDDLPF
jgi:hypothetical protein